MKKTVLKWEIGGIFFVFLLGALLHFVFEWSGNSPFVGAIASVNESVWEHFKQAFWPMAIFAAIEYPFIRKYIGNFFTGKAIAIYMMPLLESLIFYTYTAFTGKEILIVDILSFLVAAILAQFTSYKIITAGFRVRRYANYISLAFIVLLGLVLILFTFFPPHFPVLLDPETGKYGIP